jgi:PilZ domain
MNYAEPGLVSEQLPNAIEMRRSQRVVLRLPIQVRWTPPGDTAITEETVTLVVNAHGALILLAMKVKAGARVFVRNSAATQDKECRVVRVQRKLEGKGEVGLEFLRPDPKFWGLEFPPDDWKKAG